MINGAEPATTQGDVTNVATSTGEQPVMMNDLAVTDMDDE